MTNDIFDIAGGAVVHYGTKGMKWGVRKKRSRSSESSEASTLRKKKGFQLTNDELKTVNARLSLEKSYSDLNPSSTKKAQKAVVALAGTLAAVTAVAAVATRATTYAKKIIEGGA
jgi:hypothetical protein